MENEMGRRWRVVQMAGLLGPFLVASAPLWAADEQSASRVEGAGQPVSQTGRPAQEPQGPELAPGLVPNVPAGFFGYTPIPESMLPIGAEPATPVTGQPAQGPIASNLGGPVLTTGPYTLGRDDVVYIEVRGQRDFTGSFVIGPEGTIQYGLVGDITADGLTKEELRVLLEDHLKQYVRVPSVNVTIVGFNSKAIYILGRVARPGKYIMRGDRIKIRDAVIAAGLMTKHAKLRRVYIIKSDPSDPTHRIVDLKKVLYDGKMKQNIDLVHGDIVVVPTTTWGKVNDFLGELISPASKASSVASLAVL